MKNRAEAGMKSGYNLSAEYRDQACLIMIEAKNWHDVQYWMYLPSLSDELMRCVIDDFIKMIDVLNECQKKESFFLTE